MMKNENHQTSKREFKSKNLFAERRRRIRLKERIYALRVLVPKITKAFASLHFIISNVLDAVDYIKQLQNQAMKLQDELMMLPNEVGNCEANAASTGEVKPLINCKEEVRVTHVDENKLHIKISSKETTNGFFTLIDVLSNLGFEVVDINWVVFRGVATSMICLKGGDIDDVMAEDLRKLLLEMIRCDSQDCKECS